MQIKHVGGIIKQAVSEWSEDNASRLSAAIAYYTVFSIAPLIVIIIALLGWFFGKETVQGEIVREFGGLIGSEGAAAIESVVKSADQSKTGLVASIASFILVMVGAVGVFNELKNALNTVWEVTPKPGRPWWTVIRTRLVTFSIIPVIGFLLAVSLFVTAAVNFLTDYVEGLFKGLGFLVQATNFILSIGIITVLFAMVYKILPDVKTRWSDVWVGAFITAILFTIGEFAISFYLGKSTAASVFGAAGSLVVLLAWVYYSAQIVFFGAELTQVYANRFGSRILPSEHAVAMSEEERVQQGLPHKAARQDAQSGIAHYGKQASEWLDHSAEYVRQFDYKQANAGLREYVGQSPGRSLLIAGAVGLVIGAILRRR